MKDISIAVIGAGPAGILMTEKLLGTKAFNAKVYLFEKEENHGGIPYKYHTVEPNSPFKDLYSFMYDLQAEGVFSKGGRETAEEILVQAQERPLLRNISDALDLINEDLLRQDNRFKWVNSAEVSSIQERRENYQVSYRDSVGRSRDLEVDAIVCAQGGTPKEPMYNNFGRTIDLIHALDPYSNAFDAKKGIVLVGASHSAAIAFINAIEQGAKNIEVWHRGDPFREHSIESNTKSHQFTGINEPTLSKLKEALADGKERYSLVNIDKEKQRTEDQMYRSWSVVYAHGFKPNKISFSNLTGKTGLLTNIVQGDIFGESVPNIISPFTGEPLQCIYGLGLAYPFTYRKGFLPNTVEKENAKIVGIYFTNEISKIIIPDIVRAVSNRRGAE